jgi:aminoglycoside phosphotransferase (APT) family kinase protein
MSSGQNTTKVRQDIDKGILCKWITSQKELVEILDGKNINEDSISVKQFGFGQSNPTFLITVNKMKFVLRMKPKKVVHKSAHALHREFRVLNAINTFNNTVDEHQRIPVPRPYSYCTDDSILGAEFYIMEFIAGRIFVDPSFPGMSVHDRQAAYEDAVRVMANIHSMPFEDELHSFGKRGMFVLRQIERLTTVAEMQARTIGPIEGIDNVIHNLKAAAKYCPDNSSLIHGDYKIDNLIYHPIEPKIIGVLDWEMSTIGDPYCDLANLQMMYFTRSSKENIGLSGVVGLDHDLLGIPSRDQMIHDYSRFNLKASEEEALAWKGFYTTFLFYKNAVIVHGVKQRSALGVASSPVATKIASMLPLIVRMASEIWENEPPPIMFSRLSSKL